MKPVPLAALCPLAKTSAAYNYARELSKADTSSIRHASLATHQKLLRLDWEVTLHPPYSPDCTVRLPFISISSGHLEW